LLSTLYWPDEIRSIGELALPENDIEIKPAERGMAEQLVAAMTGEFNADQYHDQYREALLKIIEAKAAGQQISAPAPAPAAGVTDLMAALEASVAAAKAARTAGTADAQEAPEPIASGRSRKSVAVGPGRPAANERAERAAGDDAEQDAQPVAARRRRAS
jgi:DNA end-binding protein Ku